MKGWGNRFPTPCMLKLRGGLGGEGTKLETKTYSSYLPIFLSYLLIFYIVQGMFVLSINVYFSVSIYGSVSFFFAKL